MRWKTCDYRLWNLTSRRCPECGSPFLPSEFDFAPGTVQFCCPDCNQAYFGTSQQGHLVPAAFNCQSCNRSLHMDDMVVLPAHGLEETQTVSQGIPWLERKELGVFKALLKTIWMALISPVRLIRLAPDDGKQREAWGFALIISTLVAILGIGPFFVMSIGINFMIIGGMSSGSLLGASALIMLVTMIAALISTIVFILIWGGVTQLLLGRSALRLRYTYQALCYSAGANTASAVPCLGLYFGWIWWLVSAILMIQQTHKVSGARASLAVLAFPVSSIILLIGLYTGFLIYVFTTTGAATPFGTFGTPTTSPTGRAQSVVDGLTSYATDHAKYPTHAIELVLNYHILADDLKSPRSATTLNKIPVAGTTLKRFSILSQPKQQRAALEMIDAVPEEITAHRLGDFVFVYHGVPPASMDPTLWIVICYPDPDVNKEPPSPSIVTIGKVDGTVVAIPNQRFRRQLIRQNAIRAEYGLPPLPHPRTVTHDKPAVAYSESTSE
ncbi:MAG: hypothetical protein MI923_00175 [Phycisphaerales bacterium]|nr:hypothetical protein [Phycisphaerales bacterium]